MSCNQKSLYWLIISGWIIVLDQVTKKLAEQYLEPQRYIQLLPSLDLTLVYNAGAAFGFLNDAGGWQRYFLIALTLFVLMVLINWLCKIDFKQKILGIGLGLTIGGAIGNMLDRIFIGEVVDFISLYYAAWRWPAFNIADTAISIGVVLLFIDMIFFDFTKNPDP
ncbi:hypothetical protein TI05_01990 [Achromatium sp. WMS3]|nr:hypothetical protein TI05_01990 [Achromatium sp. WMS3]